MCASFCGGSAHLLLGGTHSGQVVLWDTRAQAAPVQRSAAAGRGGGHTLAVTCIESAGTANAHAFVTASADGRLCAWNLAALATPAESLELRAPDDATAAPSGLFERPPPQRHLAGEGLPITSLAFPHAEASRCVVGCEDGALYQLSRHGSAAGELRALHPPSAPPAAAEPPAFGSGFGGLASGALGGGGIGALGAAGGHLGPVHALHFHPPCRALPAAEELLLSASADWSARLWSRADGDAAGALATFEHTPDALLDRAGRRATRRSLPPPTPPAASRSGTLPPTPSAPSPTPRPPPTAAAARASAGRPTAAPSPSPTRRARSTCSASTRTSPSRGPTTCARSRRRWR